MMAIHKEPRGTEVVPDELPIPESHRVILDLSGSAIGWRDAQLFVPDSEDIPPANKAVLEILAQTLDDPSTRKEKKLSIRRILAMFRYYNVQYFGVKTEDDEVIVCNFFFVYPPNNCPTKLGPGFKDWKTKLVDAMGGGHYFWKVEYSLLTKKVVRLQIDSSK